MAREMTHILGNDWALRRGGGGLGRSRGRRLRSLAPGLVFPEQIELVLCHFRNDYHAEAMAQIQRAMASGVSVPAFHRFKSIVHRDNRCNTSSLL